MGEDNSGEREWAGGNGVKSATLACKRERERTARSHSCLHTSARQGVARVMARWDGQGEVDRLGGGWARVRGYGCAGTGFVTGHKIVTRTRTRAGKGSYPSRVTRTRAIP